MSISILVALIVTSSSVGILQGRTEMSKQRSRIGSARTREHEAEMGGPTGRYELVAGRLQGAGDGRCVPAAGVHLHAEDALNRPAGQRQVDADRRHRLVPVGEE